MDFLRVPFSGGVKGEPKEYQFGGPPTYFRRILRGGSYVQTFAVEARF